MANDNFWGGVISGVNNALDNDRADRRLAMDEETHDMQQAEYRRKTDRENEINSAVGDWATAGFGINNRASAPRPAVAQSHPVVTPSMGSSDGTIEQPKVSPTPNDGSRIDGEKSQPVVPASTTSMPGIPVTPPNAEDHVATADYDDFRKNLQPRVVAAFIKNGQLDHAKAFMDFARSEDGERYSRDWLTSMRAVEAGDYDGAIPGLARLYNQERPDGRRIGWASLGDGRYKVSSFDEKTGELVGQKELAAPDLAQYALSTLSPTEHVKWMLNRQVEQGKQQFEAQKAGEVADRRDTRDEYLQDRRDDRQQRAISAADARLDKRFDAMRSGDSLTSNQERQNIEIEAARQKVTSLPPADIQHRTQQYTQTGRENPDFDPSLAAQMKLSQRRKIGTDDWFDSRLNGSTSSDQPPPQQPPVVPQPVAQAPTAQRFTADPQMKGFRLGNQTSNGYEVLDSTGKLVGHYH